MKVYAFKYCPCIHESAWATISLHKSLKGAEIAMEFHKNEALKEHEDYLSRLDEEGRQWAEPFGEYERWEVKELEILD